MATPPADPYKTLGVEKDADIATIKTAYRKLVLKCHPDKVQDPALKATKQDEFQRVQQAYEVLSDDVKRKDYDNDIKLRKLRDELSRSMARSAATARPTPPKVYRDYNVRTAEPPPSFKPGPPPTSPFSSPYATSSPHFSHSWDRDIPFRTKPVNEEAQRARRVASYEKPRDERRDDPRRRKEEDDIQIRDWVREKERDRDRDRDRERDKKNRAADREKDDRREKQKRDAEKRDKERERGRIRRQGHEEKSRMMKTPYFEDPSEDEEPASRKKPLTHGATSNATVEGSGGMGSGIGNSNSSSNKRHAHQYRHENATGGRDDSPRAEQSTDKTASRIKAAADYMDKKRGSKPGGFPLFSEGHNYSTHFPDPDAAWNIKGDPPSSRRASRDDKNTHSGVEIVDGDDHLPQPELRTQPRLTKAHTSPAGAAMFMSNPSAARVPLTRASTDYAHAPPPPVPAAPSPESRRNSSKSERRRRGSFDVFDEEPRLRRSTTQPRVLRYTVDDGSPISRPIKGYSYRPPEDLYPYALHGTIGGRAGFGKLKTSPNFSPDQVRQTKRYSPDDVAYSKWQHSN